MSNSVFTGIEGYCSLPCDVVDPESFAEGCVNVDFSRFESIPCSDRCILRVCSRAMDQDERSIALAQIREAEGEDEHEATLRASILLLSGQTQRALIFNMETDIPS